MLSVWLVAKHKRFKRYLYFLARTQCVRCITQDGNGQGREEFRVWRDIFYQRWQSQELQDFLLLFVLAVRCEEVVAYFWAELERQESRRRAVSSAEDSGNSGSGSAQNQSRHDADLIGPTA